ncbi:hypothetical protein CEXT_292271 [Caerostris extrusa]|uniref:Uncharacterized protein n=1 Tax=Caerostris extrusa TaxID=172846 RepID=A0AAV4SMT7_CAEEX|nr:hypothetical protein CEXT_292271 [Caerostris extrusa]
MPAMEDFTAKVYIFADDKSHLDSMFRLQRYGILHSFRIYEMQVLDEEDYHRMLKLVLWMVNACRNAPQFFAKMLSTDKVTFTRNNSHIWSKENPRSIVPQHN